MFPGALGDRSVVEEGVGLIDDEDRPCLGCGAEGGGDLLFRLSDVL